MGRAAQGVTLLKIREGDRLIASARIAEEDADVAAAKLETDTAAAEAKAAAEAAAEAEQANAEASAEDVQSDDGGEEEE